MTREDAITLLRANVMVACDTSDKVGYGTTLNKAIEQALEMAIKALEQESKIKVLDHDEVARKLGTVDIYPASAWTTLLNDLEYLKLKICEVSE